MSKSAILAALGETTPPVAPTNERVQPLDKRDNLDWLINNFKNNKTSWESVKLSQVKEALYNWQRKKRRGSKIPQQPIVVTPQVQAWLSKRRSSGKAEFRMYQGPESSIPFGLSMASAALAETGTLVMHASDINPAAFQFLLDHHCVLLQRSDIYRYYEDYWQASYKDAARLRAIQWISGPSRSADVEQTLQLGAHGPVSLHVLLL